MEIELKACPFCGSNDLATETVDHIDYQRIYCDQCSARGPVEDCVGNYRRPAIAWNKAHAAEAKLAKVRALYERSKYSAMFARELTAILDGGSHEE